MRNGYRIIDADCHVNEPLDLWRTRLPPSLQRYALTDALEVDGQTIYANLPEEVARRMPAPRARDYFKYAIVDYDPQSQVKALKILGADVAFLYPSFGAWLFAVDSMEPAVAGELVRIYNDWLLEFCSYDRQMLRAVGAVNRHAPDGMAAEVRRLAAAGCKAVVVRPNPIKGRLLGDAAYEPFWNECERAGVAVGIHEGTYARVPAAGSDRFVTHFAMHACSHPMEQMMGLLALIEGGVLERHPRLRVALLESGGGWVPYWLWRMDRIYEEVSWEVKANVTMPPSEYFRRQCFVSVEPSESYLPQLVDVLGADNIIIGSDFPHHDHDPDVFDDAVALEGRLSKATLHKLLWDNPARLYGL